MASLFGITAADMVRKLVPAGSDYQFSIGAGESDDMTEADCLEVVETMEDRVLGLIPEKYRSLMRRVEGEVLIESATEGQASAVLGLSPVTAGTLHLYVNFGSVRSWFERRAEDRLDADLFSLNATTGEVTFTEGLHRGDVVFADYDHTAAATKFRWLKECAKSFAAVEISRRYGYFSTASGFERFEQWEAGTNIALRDLARSENPGVDGIEKIKLVRETKTVRLSQLLG